MLTVEEPDRSEYGDFQTNANLAERVCSVLENKGLKPEIVIEPTFGKGSFVLAALMAFKEVRQIIGVEIYKPYVWQTKFSILRFYLQNPEALKPRIRLFHQNVFDVNFEKLAERDGELLVLGNPPWVTNAGLSALNSNNLPRKSNFKQQSGIDAITGKGNFDIGEYISLMLLRSFHQTRGHIAFLVKNTVVKNLLFEQDKNKFRLSGMEKHHIAAQKEFGAAVEASLFFAEFGKGVELTCRELDFYTQQPVNQFGWVQGKFVSNMDAYCENARFDGVCPFEWRQGVKHDCSKIMELERLPDGHFLNGRGEPVELEENLVYGLLKSSDLKHSVLRQSRKFTVVTQRKVGQDTKYIQQQFPKTWDYLHSNRADFDSRKSSIYRDKPSFSIFGIGDYSFAPYKVAISGLYKNARFSLVLPENDKPLFLDDTCYFIGFEKYSDGAFAFALLNSNRVQDFLRSLVFWDSKRPVTKDLLMRIDLKNVVKEFDFQLILQEMERFSNIDLRLLSFESWEAFQIKLAPHKSAQLEFF
jgi:hypothetical protein